MNKHGFKNDETNDVHDWLSHSEDSYDEWRDMAMRAWEDVASDVQDRLGDATLKFADRLRSKMSDAAPGDGSLISEVARKALERVDWDQIAAHLLMECKEAGELEGVEPD